VQVPPPPAGVSASDVTYCGVVQVSWTPSSGSTGYNVYRDGHLVANVGASPYNDVPGDSASHSYVVTATYNCGQSAAGPADIGYAVQVPPPPTSVSASYGTLCGVVQVSWTASSGAASYNVYRDGAPVGNAAASPLTDTPGDTANHSYTVAAGNGLCTSAASAPTTGYAEFCAADFSVSASPTSRTINAGKSTTYTAKYTPILGFSGTVTWSVSGLPSGVSGSFTPSGTNTVLLTVNSAKSTRSGTYTLTLVGTSGVLHHSTTVTLIVR